MAESTAFDAKAIGAQYKMVLEARMSQSATTVESDARGRCPVRATDKRRGTKKLLVPGSAYKLGSVSITSQEFALAAKRARGKRLGAAPALPMEVTRRIIDERANGLTSQAIADGLMADGIPTARGKTRWFPATIKAVTISHNAAALT